MITEKKRMMTYTYFNRSPRSMISSTHLFSFKKKVIPLMVRITFPTITVDLRNPNFLGDWSGSARTKIKKAKHDHLAIERGNFLLADVLKLFMQTAKRKGLRGYVPEAFQNFPKVEVSAIYKDGEILCGHVWVIDKEEMRALLYVNASGQMDSQIDASLVGRAHYFLLWQDALRFQQNGMETMDLMGYTPQTNDPLLKGVYQWKAATHGNEEVLYHYYPIWFHILRKFRNILSS